MKLFGKKRGLVLAAIFLLIINLFLLTSCTKFPGRTPTNNLGNFEDNKYYQGFDGMLMRFSENMPPYRMYYYGDQYDNSFDVNVEVANVGSAWSRGGIFLSGYDPTMIEFLGINPARSSGQSCMIDIGNIGFGEFGGTMRCENFFIGAGDQGTFEIGFQNLFGSGGSYSDRLDLNRLFGGIDLWYQHSAGGQDRMSIGFNNPGIDIEYANHGRLLIALFEGLDFSRNFGVEYLLEGDNQDYPGGGLAYINFDGNIVRWPPGLDQTYQSFLITNCFLYATYAAPVVCIDPTPFSQNQKVCVPRQFTGTKGQGAPVAVTYVEQENTPRQAIFTIHVKNVGGGQVYDPGRLEMCSPYFPGRVTSEDLNIVYIGDIRVSGDLQRLHCMPNDFVRLDPKTGEGIIVCSYDIPFSGLKSAYESPLVVELWYGYSKTMEKKVYIKRAI
ncbi:hypothetical protein JW756_01790 [Candidatus Woesearchaeota archaeon]|nr:hypothetical protein [Candidatus Woesearchaeota archaeon]